MKKNITFSAIIALILTISGLLINLICSLLFKFAPFALSISGGDARIYTGFGIDCIKIFELSPQGGVSITFDFNLISFVVSYVIMFVIVLIVKTIINKKGK